MTDPFDDPFEADDPFGPDGGDDFETARDGFPKVEWLVGRLVLAWPIEIVTVQGTDGPYDAMECRVVVLDGEPTEDMPKIPYEIIPFRFNSDSIIKDMKHLLGTKKAKLARVHEKPSKRNKLIMARFFIAPTAADIATARAWTSTHK